MMIACTESTYADNQNPDPLSIILTRYRTLLLSGKAPDAKTLQKYQKALLEDGHWPDVDYNTKGKAVVCHRSAVE